MVFLSQPKCEHESISASLSVMVYVNFMKHQKKDRGKLGNLTLCKKPCFRSITKPLFRSKHVQRIKTHIMEVYLKI